MPLAKAGDHVPPVCADAPNNVKRSTAALVVQSERLATSSPATGGWVTVKVTDPLAGALQLCVPEVATLTKVYVMSPIIPPVMVAFPAASS